MLCFSNTDNNDHVGCRGNTARALAQWQCLVASCEATVVLHQMMLLVPSHSGIIVIKIAVEFVTFDYIVDKSAARNKIFLPHFYNFAKLLRPRPHPTPPQHRPRAGLGKTKKLAQLEGVEVHHGRGVCVCGCGWVSIQVPTLINYGARVFCSHLNIHSLYISRVQNSCGVVLVFWFWWKTNFDITYVLSVQYTCAVVSVFWLWWEIVLWREIVLKTRTPFDFR